MKSYNEAFSQKEFDYGQYQLKHVRGKDLNEVQKMLGKIVYWAGYFGEKELVFLYMRAVGLSPFAKLFRGLSVVTACVQGH
jgi:hypothetical protein